ncbi:MAG: hypothetical protein ACREOU_06285 [Candidatus Eiseniibacteriota bacterium]
MSADVFLIHKARHIALKPVMDKGKKLVEMEYVDDEGREHKYRGKGPHSAHDPVRVSILQQECVMWESDAGPFTVFMKDEPPFWRSFPAHSTLGEDGIHRVSSGPCRTDEKGKKREIHFLVRFTGAHADAEELDPHLVPFP